MTSRFEFPKTEDGWKQLIEGIASLYGLDAFFCEDFIERAFPPCDEIREV